MLTESDLIIKHNILKLKQEKHAIILAHYYQDRNIQEIADFVGDSLGLSVKASETDAEMIVFAGVHFMAETAKIINPDKKVILPDLEAGCSLSDSCSAEEFKQFRALHPGYVAVTYINCSAEVKALSDIICTSSNALRIIESLPKDTDIIFAPDKNLGKYLNSITGRKMLLWDGACAVHEAFSAEKISVLKMEFPEVELLVHPESQAHILDMADFIGSTASMIQYAQKSKSNAFIVATEAGILYKMKEAVPHKHLISAPAVEQNACACSECPYMKVNTLEKLYQSMLLESPSIELDEDLRQKALKPVQRMLEFAN